MRRLVPIACVLALVSALSGCSVATQSTATPLPSQLGLGPTPTTTTLPPSHTARQLKVYFLKAGLLFPVEEYYSTDPLDVAIADLADGVTADQAARGITTAFSESPAEITSAGPVGKNGIARIEVDQAFTNLPAEAYEQASAQIVFTVTGLPNVDSVEFLYLGYPLDAVVPPDQLLKGAATRNDYCAFAPVSYIPCHKTTGTVGIT
jgi:Sporulation and spore germination